MKLSKDFVLRQVAATWVVLPLKSDTLDFNGMIRLNESGALLWKKLEAGADRAALVAALEEAYAVSAAEAEADVEAFLAPLFAAGFLEA